MRAVFWKEFRELPGLVLALLAVPIAWLGLGARYDGEELAACMICGGVLLGLVQGLWDWMRSEDVFFRHRPLSDSRIEWARTAAGATQLLLMVACLLGTLTLAVNFAAEPGSAAPTAPEVLFCTGLALACWAVLRAGLALKHSVASALFLAVVPFAVVAPAYWETDGRTAMLLIAVVLALGIAVRFSRTRVPALLLLTAWAGLGVAGWARAGTTALLFEAYPHVFLRPSGDVGYRRNAKLVDEHRREIGEVDGTVFVARAGVNSRTVDPFSSESATVIRRLGGGGLRGPRRVAWRDSVAVQLSGWRWRRWELRGERMVCLDDVTGAVLKTLRTRFVDPLWRFGARLRSIKTNFGVVRHGDGRVTLLVRRDGEEALKEMTLRVDPDADFAGWSGRRILLQSRMRLYVVDILSGDVVRQVGVDEKERSRRFGFHSASNPDRWGWSSWLPPADPVRVAFRLRLAHPDASADLLMHDVTLEPTGILENALAGLGGIVALARPPLLNAAAFAAPARSAWDALPDPLLDPWFRGRKRFGWLVVSIAVGLLCALRARAQARLRLDRGCGLWVVAGLLLGPLGLLWMRIGVPKLHVEDVGGRHAAVNLNRDWPEPCANALSVLENV